MGTIPVNSILVNDRELTYSRYLFISAFSAATNMSDPEKAFFRDISIVNEFGLHARAAAKIAAIAKDSKAGVWMKKDEHQADASSILDILTLCGEKGTRIRLIVKDPSDRHILNAIVTLIESGFGE